MKVCVVGRGKVGRTLQRELSRAGVTVSLARGLPLAKALARCDVYLLAVPDAAIAAVASQLSDRLERHAVVLHCAGARGLEPLLPLVARGTAVGVFHPLVSFASARAELSMRGATFTAFGDRRALHAARWLAKQLGARCVVIAPPGASYHAAAALVANGTAALAQVGTQILVQLGFEQRAAERALSGLLASVATNVAVLGVPRALTGPVVRGDVATVARHLDALRALDPQLADAYAAVQPLVIASARSAGLAAQPARQLRKLVTRR